MDHHSEAEKGHCQHYIVQCNGQCLTVIDIDD